MNVHILAIGRLPARAAERTIFDDYVRRFGQICRPLGLRGLSEHELEPKRGTGKAAEAEVLAKRLPDGAIIVALDERGQQFSSPDFAAKIAGFRDQGRGDLAFVIGGADGLDPSLRDRADLILSFGAMVWPHMLARMMLAEQLYRAATILSGAPYHRA
ncbi:MAG: 23S rRNA (pseudouridine(1915)-N(3))-methyltransferase RlmH [Pseudomonadota bacterium]